MQSQPFGGNTANEEDLTDSRFNDKYTNPLQEQSFNSNPSKYKRQITSESTNGVRQLSEISKVSGKNDFGQNGKSIGVIPEQITFEEVLVSPQGQLLLSSQNHSTKLLLKNNLSAKVEIELSSGQQDKISVEPKTLTLSAFESQQVRVSLKTKELSKYVEKQERCTLQDYVLIKSEFFTQKVNVSLHLVKHDEGSRASLLESSLMSSRGMRKSNFGGRAPIAGGGMTNALQKMRSLSKDIKEQKRSRESSMQKTVLNDSSLKEDEEKLAGGGDYASGGRTMVKPENKKITIDNYNPDSFRKHEAEQPYDLNKFGDQKPTNMTASFTKSQLLSIDNQAQNQGKIDKSFCLQDLETSQLRNDLDDSNMDCSADLEDIQRSNLPDPSYDLPKQISLKRHQNDRSMHLNQLDENQFSYSRTNTQSLGQNAEQHQNEISGLSQFENTERLAQMQTEISSFQKIIAKQQETIKIEQGKRVELEDVLSRSQLGVNFGESSVMERIHTLIGQNNPDIDELIQLTVAQDRMEQQRIQADKDKQVLEILNAKDEEIIELQANYQQALDEIDALDKNQQDFDKESTISLDLKKRVKELQQENTKMMNEQVQAQREFQSILTQLNQELQMKTDRLSTSLRENQMLEEKLQELETMSKSSFQDKGEMSDLKVQLKRHDQEKKATEKRNQEITMQFTSQIKMLKDKLNQSYQDIQKIALQQSGIKLDHQGFNSQGSTFDTNETRRGVKVENSTQTGFQETGNDSSQEARKLQKKITELEQEREETFRILGQAETKIEGLQHEDLVKYTNFLKMQVNKLSLQKLNDTDMDISGSDSTPQDWALILEENLALKRAKVDSSDFSERQLASREEVIRQLKAQLKNQETQFQREMKRAFSNPSSRPTDDSESLSTELNQQFQELKIAMTKLWVKFEETELDSNQADMHEVVSQLKKQVKMGSETILKLSTRLCEKEQMLEQLPYFQNSLILNRVLQVRQSLLQDQIKGLKEHVQDLANQNSQADKNQQADVLKLENDNHSLQAETGELKANLEEKEKYLNWYGESLRQQAEIQSDDRVSSQDERIKEYLRQEVLPFLKQQTEENCDRETMELVKRFCDLQLQLDSMKQLKNQQDSQMKADMAKIEHLEKTIINIRMQKSEENKEYELKREISLKNTEILRLKNEVKSSSLGHGLSKIDNLVKKIESSHSLSSGFTEYEPLQIHAQVQSLQKKVMDLRSEQLIEIEEVRTSAQVELVEEKKKLQLQKEMFIQKYQPAYQFGTDSDSANTIQELQAKLEASNSELQILERKYEDEKLQQMKLFDEIQAYKEVIQELKIDFCRQPYVQTVHDALNEDTMQDETYYQLQNTFNQQRLQQTSQNISVEGENKRPGSKTRMVKPLQNNQTQSRKKLKTLNQRRGSNESDELPSMVAFPVNQINNPMLTNRSFLNQTAAGQPITDRTQNCFQFMPPKIVSQLINAKLLEKQLKIEMKNCKINEDRARNELRKVLLEKASLNHVDSFIHQERAKSHELEDKLREIEFQNLLKCNGGQSHDENEEEKVEEKEVPGSDYALLVNTVIHLISADQTSDIIAANELESVYKIIIHQLSWKINSLCDQQGSLVGIEQFVPSDEKSHRLWYLQLLESQVKSAEAATQSLFDFIGRLQIDIKGCLTAEAQIKATAMNLAQSTQETNQEVQLLKSITQLIKAELEQQINPAAFSMKSTTNPFLENKNLMSSNSIDLQSQLKITNKVKKSLEQDLVQMKKNIYETKNEYRKEIEEASKHNKDLEKNLRKIEKELPKLRTENRALFDQARKLEEENVELISQNKQNVNVESKLLKPLNKKLQTTIKQMDLERQKDQQRWIEEKQDLMSKMQNIENLLNQQKEDHQTLDSIVQHDVLKTTLDSVQEENHFFQQSVDKMKSKQSKIKNKLLQKDTQVKELLKQETNLKLRIDQLIEDGEKQKHSNDALQFDVNEKELVIKQSQFQNRQLTQDIQSLQRDKNHQIQTVSSNSNQIQQELESLRQNFSECLQEINKKQQSEAMYQQMIEHLTQNIDAMKGKVEDHQRLQSDEIERFQQNDETIHNQMKLLKSQNLAMKQDNFNLIARIEISERSAYDKDQELSLTKVQLNDQVRICEDIKIQLDETCQGMLKMRENYIKLEIDKNHMFEQLNSKIEEIKESRDSLSELYENQLDILKGRLAQKGVEKEADLLYQLSQRDSLIKSLKKEVSIMKAKLKSKAQIDQANQESMLENIEEEFDKLMIKARKFNELQEKMIETEAKNQKTEGWNIVLLKQTSELDNTIQELREEMEEFLQKEGHDEKLQKMHSQQTEQNRQLKQKLKSLEIELSQLKVSWISPDRYKAELNQLKELQSQSKANKEEVTRKRELIVSLKSQKEALEKGIQPLNATIVKLQEENAKLNKQIKSFQGPQTSLKQLKTDLDQAKEKVSQHLTENQLLSDKIKSLKQEVSRKDVTIKDLLQSRERQKAAKGHHFIADGGHTTNENDSSISIEEVETLKRKVRDLKQRHKTDLDVKDNQVRALKAKIEQLQDSLDSFEQQSEHSKYDMPMQIKETTMLEKQVKKDKSMFKKYEAIIKELTFGLIEVTSLLQEVNKSVPAEKEGSSKSGNAIDINQIFGNDDPQFYKDGMDILGIEMGQLAEFINPIQASRDNKLKLSLDKFKKISATKDGLSDLLLQKQDKSLLILSEIATVVEECKNIINGTCK